MSDDQTLTKVHIELPNHWMFKGESMWAKSLGNDLYEIQNIPFCAYGLNCGDVVHATADSPDLKPEIRTVVRPSGNQTIRVSFNIEKDQQQSYIHAIESKGGEIERAQPKFICINIPPGVSYKDLCEYLDEQEAAGSLAYETCEERLPGSFDDRPEGASNEA